MGDRPDPDALLEAVRLESHKATRGKLTVFFGSAPGVGKTYAMLEAARFEREEGRDIVVGIVETHGRYDTGALLLGLEILPRNKTEYKGVRLEELDLDAALKRRPGLILVDELAHTNAPGSRHTKRWQDVEELLAAGLDVYSTLNVQHIESLVDVVASITHVVVRETVPDSVFEGADDVRLIDLPIDQLLERLREGKVYVPEQAARARESFFREGNLIALRELALRITAQRVDAQMRRYREAHGIEGVWAAAERLLVCVSPSPASEALIRGARRLAGSLHADWIAAYVETPSSLRLSDGDRKRVTDHLRLAQSLGAETVTLSGPRSADEITRFARTRNVTRIIVGKPTHPPWFDRFFPSFIDQLVRLSGDVDVHVLTGASLTAKSASTPEMPKPRAALAPYVGSVAAVIAVTALGRVLFTSSAYIADVVLVYLLAIVLVSLRWGLGPSLCAAVCAVIGLDLFFIPPFNTLAVSDVTHIPTFGVMFLVAVIISGLTKRVRDQAEAAREREIRTASLYSLSDALSRAETTDAVASAGASHVHDVFSASARVLVSDGKRLVGELEEKERGVADWTLQNGRSAGAGTDTLPASAWTYFPLARVGVLAVRLPEGTPFDHGRRQHLEAFARQIEGALERTRLADQAHVAQLRIEAEQLRNSLLSSVSHDLRTPLAVITGAASTLLDAKLAPPMRTELTGTILSEAERLNRLVRNLLDMTRLEAGAVEVRKEWQPIEEAVGAAMERVETIIGTRPVKIELPEDLPLVPFDSILLQQVFVNLLENAAKYTPLDSELTVTAKHRTGSDGKSEVEITVADRGPGLAKGDEDRIFAKFYRAEKGRGGGVGLGLTICKGIVTAHGGRIWAAPRAGGGAEFHFTLPIEGSPPDIMEVASA